MAKPQAQRQKDYRLRHPEKVRAARKEYVRQNRAKINEIRTRSHHADPTRKLLSLARRRAKLRGLDFDLDKKDLVIPEFCPVLGIKIVVGGAGTGFCDASPTLDRIDNAKGYVRDNVAVVSWRANRIKCDATVEELEKVFLFYRDLRRAEA